MADYAFMPEDEQPESAAEWTGSGDPEVALSCPSCGTLLDGEELFEVYRVCPSCRRHFWLPARERLHLLVDPGSFAETNAELASIDPLTFRDPLPLPDRIAEEQERGGISSAVITGVGAIGGHSAVLVLLDFAFLGGSIGIVAGEKIMLAMEHAATRRLPLIVVCSGGVGRKQEGMLSLAQLSKMAHAAGRLHRAGLPVITLLTHPTTGGVYAGLANQADIILAEPGAYVAFQPSRERSASVASTAEALLARGLIDDVVDRTRQRDLFAALLDLFTHRGTPRPGASSAAPAPASLRAVDEASLARHPERPTAADYLQRIMPVFVELHGDRLSGDDPAVICGLGRIDGVSVAVIAQERGRGDEQQLRRHGRMGAAGYRKAVRLMRLAGHLDLPLITLLDTPGTLSGTDADDSELGLAVGQALAMMSQLPVPIISVVIGEAGSIGALALGIGDRILMLEHAVYSVLSPESLRARDTERVADAASLQLTARDCLRLGVIDAIVAEPHPGAHADPGHAATLVRGAITTALAELTAITPRRLLDDRARKVRTLGQTTPEGQEAARRELRELQELQRTISRSLLDLRERWEQRQLSLPTLPPLPHLANFPSLPNLANLRRVSVTRHDVADFASRLAATGREIVRSQVESRAHMREAARPPEAGVEPEQAPSTSVEKLERSS
jgi:acetyl-CoA carboxylase carboxyl transferase subunit beta